MLELGSKWCSQAGLSYKSVFTHLGFRHVSVDWNGEHGSLIRDVRKPLWDELGQFDMVTNFGTTEHVSDQWGVWQNIHRCTKVGGVLISMTPYHDGKSWWWHGEWYPTERFFVDFAASNGWYIERMCCQKEPPHENLYVRMRRISDVFADVQISSEKIVRNKIRPR